MTLQLLSSPSSSQTRFSLGSLIHAVFIILKGSCHGEELQLEESARRNYFDPKAAVTLAAQTGGLARIRDQHQEARGADYARCEVSCKVLRTDTNLDQIQEITRGWAAVQFPTECGEKALGAIVHHQIQPDLQGGRDRLEQRHP